MPVTGEYILVSYVADDERRFTIAEFTGHREGVFPLLHFGREPAWGMVPGSFSPEELKGRLREMIAACDKPGFYLTPEKLVPAKLEKLKK